MVSCPKKKFPLCVSICLFYYYIFIIILYFIVFCFYYYILFFLFIFLYILYIISYHFIIIFGCLNIADCKLHNTEVVSLKYLHGTWHKEMPWSYLSSVSTWRCYLKEPGVAEHHTLPSVLGEALPQSSASGGTSFPPLSELLRASLHCEIQTNFPAHPPLVCLLF